MKLRDSRRRILGAACATTAAAAIRAAGGLAVVLPSLVRAAAPAAPPIAERFVAVPASHSSPPPLALSDLEGKRHDLSDYRGRVVVVNFWATWCAPCVEEMPTLQLLQARFDKEPLTVLAVNYGESVERVTDFVERMALDLPVLLDAFHRVRHDWKVRALPATFLIDPRGRLRYSIRGELDWTDEAVVARVRSLLR